MRTRSPGFPTRRALWVVVGCALLAAANPSWAAPEEALAVLEGSVDPGRLMVYLAAPDPGRLVRPTSEPGNLAVGVAARLEGLAADVRPVLPPARIESHLKANGGVELPSSLERLQGWHVVELADPSRTLEALQRLRGLEGVAQVEPAYRHEICLVPDDPRISGQIYLSSIRAYEAFETVRAAEGEVLVAIVDGGSEWLHEDLRGNVWSRPGEIAGNGIDDDGNGYVDDVHGWNFALGTPDPTGLPQTPRNASHGTHVAGIVSAVTDNGIGVAGVSWNAQLLLINESHPEIDTAIRGYDGLLYAALSGADVVNASWGRIGRWSQYEADVIRAVTDLGTVVVAAAGNSIDGMAFYPAFYPGVLSVARVGPDLMPHRSSNADHWIDVAAPGSLIDNLLSDNSYGTLGGTSQSAAVVSGVAALVRTLHPEWSPAQVKEQIRWSARSYDDELPPELEHRAGTGVVDAYRAVTDAPAGLHLVGLKLMDQDEDARVEPGEMVTFGFDLVNELATADRVRIRMEIDDPDLVPLQQTLFLGRIAAGARLPVTRGLSAWVKDTAELGRLVPVLFVIEADGREVHQAFYPEFLPLHATVATGRLEVTVTGNGKIGFSHVTRARDPGGVGIRRPGGPSFMLGGSLLVGDGPDRVSDAVISPRPQSILEDFTPEQGQALRFPSSDRADVEVVSVYGDRSSGVPLGIRVEQRALGYRDPGRDGFVLGIFDVSTSAQERAGVRMGVLVDWELPGEEFDRDQIRFDATHQLVYTVYQGDDPVEAAGIAVLRGPGPVGWNWFYDLPQEGESRPYLYDPADLSRKLPDADLWSLLSHSEGDTPSAVGGVGSVVWCGPFDLRLQAPARMVLAIVMGEDLAALRGEVEAARIALEGIEERVYGGLPDAGLLLPNVPNPFNPRTDIRFTLPREGLVTLRIYDSRGRLVRSLLDESRRAGFHRVTWSGLDLHRSPVASGVYHVELRTPFGTDRRAITLIR